MAPSWFQILIVVVLLVLLFGRGKISELMGDVAKGIKSFKKGIAEDETMQRRRKPSTTRLRKRSATPRRPVKKPRQTAKPAA